MATKRSRRQNTKNSDSRLNDLMERLSAHFYRKRSGRFSGTRSLRWTRQAWNGWLPALGNGIPADFWKSVKKASCRTGDSLSPGD